MITTKTASGQYWQHGIQNMLQKKNIQDEKLEDHVQSKIRMNIVVQLMATHFTEGEGDNITI